MALIALALLAALLTAPLRSRRRPATPRSARASTTPARSRTDGSVECWGRNLYGESTDQAGSFLQVTPADPTPARSRTPVRPTGARFTAGGTTDDGHASPPAGDFLQISAGDDYTCGAHRGRQRRLLGEKLPTGEANDKAGPYLQVSASTYHACGLKPDGSVHCWGGDCVGRSSGRYGPYTQVSAGGHHTCAIRRDNDAVECWGAGHP